MLVNHAQLMSKEVYSPKISEEDLRSIRKVAKRAKMFEDLSARQTNKHCHALPRPLLPAQCARIQFRLPLSEFSFLPQILAKM